VAQVVLRPGHATLADWRAIYRGAVVTVDPSCHAAIANGARAVDAILTKVRDRQKAVGYNGNYREWIAKVTPPDLQ